MEIFTGELLKVTPVNIPPTAPAIRQLERLALLSRLLVALLRP